MLTQYLDVPHHLFKQNNYQDELEEKHTTLPFGSSLRDLNEQYISDIKYIRKKWNKVSDGKFETRT